MKFSFSISNSKRIRKLFRAKTDFIDIYISSEIVILFTDTTETFSFAILPIGIADTSASVSFRIPRDGFISLLDDGVVSITIANSIIYLRIDNGVHSYTMSFSEQVCNIIPMSSKLDLINRCTEYPQLKIADLGLIAKLSKSSKLPLTVDGGFGFITLNNLMIYSRTECDNLAIFPQSLTHLLSICDDTDKIYNVENLVIYSDDSCGVAVNKAVSLQNCDYEYIRTRKRLSVVDVDFSSASSLISRIRNYVSVNFDLNAKILSLIDETNSKFSTDVSVVEVSTVKSEDELLESVLTAPAMSFLPDLTLPAEVFKQILYLTKSKKLRLSFTKRLICVRVSDNTLLVCNRR